MKTNLKFCVKMFVFFIAIIGLTSCEQSFVEKPKNTISVEKAEELSNNFDLRHRAMSEVIGKEDNRSSWHSLEELEQYIAYIKQEGIKRKLEVDGIRIYFGAYDSIESGREKLSTLFLVPTVKSKSNKNSGVKSFAPMQDEPSEDTKDIDPLNLGNQGNPPSKKYK